MPECINVLQTDRLQASRDCANAGMGEEGPSMTKDTLGLHAPVLNGSHPTEPYLSMAILAKPYQYSARFTDFAHSAPYWPDPHLPLQTPAYPLSAAR